MVKTYNVYTGSKDHDYFKTVKEEDYLKVVEELKTVKDELSCLKFNSKNKLKIKDNVLQEVKKQREELMDKLNEKSNDLKTLGKICNEQRVELKEKDEDIEELNKRITCLELGIEEEKEKLWVLEYKYFISRDDYKTITLDPQPKEELFELIGMDSDNWIQFKMWEVN